MGLAASQARFLCITARKAECEYKSTELAQQKLELTSRMADISRDYAQAMNATKLVWQNDAVEGNYAIGYGMLMSPSTVNGYDPYLITSQSGAIILNNSYAAAARAAGLSKAGGAGSQAQRDQFIAALSAQGMIAENVANKITKDDYTGIDLTSATPFVNAIVADNNIARDWNQFAGMGAEPMLKGNNAVFITLKDMMKEESIGGQPVDWGKLLTLNLDTGTGALSRPETSDNTLTFTEKDKNVEWLTNLQKKAIAGNLTNSDIAKFDAFVDNNTKLGYIQAGHKIGNDQNDAANKIKAVIDLYNGTHTNSENKSVSNYPTLDRDNYKKNGYEYIVSGGTIGEKEQLNGICNNGLWLNQDNLRKMTLSDILLGDVVLFHHSYDGKHNIATKNIALEAELILESMAKSFGYTTNTNDEGKLEVTGHGLNVDDNGAQALKYAFDMVKVKFLGTKDSITTKNGVGSSSGVVNEDIYKQAKQYNRIAHVRDDNFAMVSLSNMMRAFLTYYQNYIDKEVNDYVVGRAVNESYFVTDNRNFGYVVEPSEKVETDVPTIMADFYDQLYNNILEHGWREDSSVQDPQYLENALKNGVYTMSSLNRDDGYYYQTRYNETGYIVEVPDSDAIARAEAEFSAMKAEITFKENKIDVQTKKLDTEIAALTTEYDSVKNMISQTIQKTFQMFQQ